MKKIVYFCLAVSILAVGFTCACAQVKAAKKAVFIIASANFQDDELAQPLGVLKGKGIAVTIASTTLEEITGMNGGKAKADILLNNVVVDDYDAVVFIGGSGAAQYLDDPVAHTLARETLAKNKILGAICIAPQILANAGVLKGKKATVYPTEGDKLKACDVNYTAQAVERDGFIITADGPKSAVAFGEALSKALLNG